MPAVLIWIGGAALALFGLRQAGETVESTGEGLRDLAIAGALIAGTYVVLKKVK